jgi:hypothetical protein
MNEGSLEITFLVIAKFCVAEFCVGVHGVEVKTEPEPT